MAKGENSKRRSLKYLPNLITLVRFVLVPVLLFVPPLGAAFYAVYLLCGLSDILDGWLARKIGSESRLGAALDSAADFVMVAVLLLRLYPVIAPAAGVILWVAAIAAMRFAAALAAYLRHGVFGFLHTYANKMTGIVLLLYPLSLAVTRSAIVIYILCAAATVSGDEELAIELTSREWNPNRKSIFASRHKPIS